MGVIHDYKHLVVLRTLIGCIEASFAPGVLLVLSSWYKKTEQSKRFAVYISAAILSGAFGSLLAAVIVDGLEGSHGIRGWRWLFIVEGAVTVGFALLSMLFLLDFPPTSRLLSERERYVAIRRLATENVTAASEDPSQRLSGMKATFDAIKNWKTWLFVIGYMVVITRFLSEQWLLITVAGHCRFEYFILLLSDSR
jgi:MFS family permease